MARDRHRSGTAVGTTDRGQTAFDFSIGVSIFLIVLISVLVFVPSVFGATNESDEGSDQVATDRVAGFLAGDAFGSPNDPAELEPSCLRAFFADTAGCGFGANNELTADLGFKTNTPVNVTVEADVNGDGSRERLCWDDDSNAVVSVADADCDPAVGDVPFTAGTDATRNNEFTTATRAGRLGIQRVFVVVRTW